MNNHTIPGITTAQWELLYPKDWEQSKEADGLLNCAATWDSSSDLINYDDLGLGALDLLRLYLTWHNPLSDFIEEEGLENFIEGLVLEPDMKSVTIFQKEAMTAIPLTDAYTQLAHSYLSNCGVSLGYRQQAVDLAFLCAQAFSPAMGFSPSAFLSEYYQTILKNADEGHQNYLSEIAPLKDTESLNLREENLKELLDDDQKVYYILNAGSHLEKRVLVETLLKHTTPPHA